MAINLTVMEKGNLLNLFWDGPPVSNRQILVQIVLVEGN
jgi:hypothetical protein